MKRVVLLPLLFAACRTTERVSPTPSVSGSERIELKRNSDWERYGGRYITLEGIFSHDLKGQTAAVTIDNGLRIVIPHADVHLAGTNWFQYTGRRVVVGGILHTHPRAVSGYDQLTLDLRDLKVP